VEDRQQYHENISELLSLVLNIFVSQHFKAILRALQHKMRCLYSADHNYILILNIFDSVPYEFILY